MKRLKYPYATPRETYPEDIDRIVEVCKAEGYEISREDACQAWIEYSEDMCAGWMNLGDDDCIFAVVFPRCEEDFDVD